MTEPTPLETLATKIVDYVRQYDFVTFVEVDRIAKEVLGDGASGDVALMAPPQFSHTVIWIGLSDTYASAVDKALAEGKLTFFPASWLSYLIDGGVLKLPLAKRPRSYKSNHWLPVCLRPDEKVLPLLLKKGIKPKRGAVTGL